MHILTQSPEPVSPDSIPPSEPFTMPPEPLQPRPEPLVPAPEPRPPPTEPAPPPSGPVMVGLPPGARPDSDSQCAVQSIRRQS